MAPFRAVESPPSGGLSPRRAICRGIWARKLAPRATSKPDPKRRENAFLQGLERLEWIVGGKFATGNGTDDADDADDSAIEELAAMIERGEELPSPQQPHESAESFIERLEVGLSVFKDVVAGKLKVGNILPGPPVEENGGSISNLLIDVPEDRSTLPPDIPEHAMAMYTFGERILYVLRRGFKAQSLCKPLELLDSYGLLADDLTLTTPLRVADDGTIRSKPDIMKYCNILDRQTARVQCSNLLMSFPQLRDPGQFRSRPDPPVSKATCDVVLFFQVPKFYRSYLASRGEGYNKVTVQEQVVRGIAVPDSPFPRYGPSDTGNGGTPSIIVPCEPHNSLSQLSQLGVEMLQNDWLKYPETSCSSSGQRSRVLGDTDEQCSVDENDSNGENENRDAQIDQTAGERSDRESIDMLTPDEAEDMLRSLLGNDFHAIVQQLPRKKTTPNHVDPEYECMFDESARWKHEFRLATTWTFDVDLKERHVSELHVGLSWINLGPVHERDVFPLLHYLLLNSNVSSG